MPVFTVETPAPRNSNDVYRMRRQGRRLNGLGAEDFQFDANLWDEPPATSTDIGPSGGAEAHEQYQESASFWESTGGALRNFSSWLTEGSGSDLIKTGMSYYGAREDRKEAESRADLARREAALAERRSAAETEEARFREQQLRQASGRSGQNGMPGWVLPASIAGGATVLLLILMKSK